MTMIGSQDFSCRFDGRWLDYGMKGIDLGKPGNSDNFDSPRLESDGGNQENVQT